MKKLILFTFACLPFLLSAQFPDPYQRFQFDHGLEYDSNISSPSEFLGYELGDRFTLYADAFDYFRLLDEQSDKLSLRTYGQTYEGKDLIAAVITSETNHDQLEELRTNNLKFSEPANFSQSELDELAASQPVFLSYSYNIHGNEASSTEAAMQVAYRLIAARDDRTQHILDNAVIIFYVCINPDGRDRYAYWYNSVQRHQSAEEPQDLEHYAPWPNGRTNHYWFDLNRDWVWGVHPESRGHTAEYQRWMPQVHADYHEQGYNANYFTVPGTTPTNRMLQDEYVAWADTFGKANIAEFDRHDIGYFTRERFDFFYPSYGSSYPSVMGAVGMLTEQGGIGGGTAIETSDGHVLTLRQRVFDHYLTSIATINKAVEHREELINFQMKSMDPANAKSPVKAYVLPAENNEYLPEVLRMMLHHGVKLSRATADGQAELFDFRSGERLRTGISEGDYIIDCNQSRNLFINSIMTPTLEIEDSVMYDMSTWSAAIAYNLEAYSTEQELSIPVESVTEIAAEVGSVTGEGDYAWVVDWNQRYAPAALAELWRKGYRVRCAEKAFHDGTREYPPGSLIVLKGRNLDKAVQMAQDMVDIASQTAVNITRQPTGRMMKGIDLTSPDARPVQNPRVALLVEPPFSTYTCGQIYFLFDRETRLPVDRVRVSALQQTALPKFGLRYGSVDMNEYDVMILAGGGEHLGKVFTEDQLETLKSWVESGGVLIAIESAFEFFTEDKSEFTKAALHEVERDSSEWAQYIRYEERTDYFGKKRIPGAAMNAHIDNSHPLGFGVNDEIYSLRFGSTVLKPSIDLQAVGHYEKDPANLLAAGYASPENLEHLAGQVFAGVIPMGRGKVVLLADNTQYRMFWRGPSRIMQNAVMLLPGL